MLAEEEAAEHCYRDRDGERTGQNVTVDERRRRLRLIDYLRCVELHI
jgi:hypothetical protein